MFQKYLFQKRWIQPWKYIALITMIPLLLSCGQGTTPQTISHHATTTQPATVSSPTIYIASQTAIAAYRAIDGQLLWTIPTNQPLVTISDQLYVASDNLMAVLKTTGQTLWNVQLSTNANAMVVANGVIYIGCQQMVQAYEARTGHLLWQQSLTPGLGTISQLVLHGTSLYAIAGATLFALDATSGQTNWSFEADTGDLIKTLLFTVTTTIVQTDLSVRAFAAQTGKPLWQRTTNTIALGLEGTTLYTVFMDPSSGESPNPGPTGMRAINAQTGKVLWQTQTPIQFNDTGIITTDTIYWISGTAKNVLTAWNTNNGQQRWQQSTTSSYQLLIATGQHIDTMTASGTIMAYNTANGHEAWQQSTPAINATIFIQQNQTLYTAGDNGTVVAVRDTDGTIMVSIPTQMDIQQMMIA